jgi:hypothetical protein
MEWVALGTRGRLAIEFHYLCEFHPNVKVHAALLTDGGNGIFLLDRQRSVIRGVVTPLWAKTESMLMPRHRKWGVFRIKLWWRV